MRNRAFASIVALLLLPGALTAQRRGGGLGGRLGRAGGRAPLPPTAPAIAREMQYHRIALSVESYPMISFVEAPGFLMPGSVSHWTSYGVGERVSYRVKPFLSATLDMTTSPFGGMASIETAELGTRLGPELWDHKAHPFIDLRAGYMFAYEGNNTSTSGSIVDASLQGYRSARYGHGLGGIAGAGLEYSLTRTLMATTSASVMRNHMTTHRISASTTGIGGGDYRMRSYRLTLGLRYNPVRAMTSGQQR